LDSVRSYREMEGSGRWERLELELVLACMLGVGEAVREGMEY
jgi:hypothetical protein